MYLMLLHSVINAEEQFVLGKSSTGIDITGYSFGSGKNCIVIIGGIHGRYEANTIQLTEKLITYCQERENKLRLTIKILYNLNPDGFIYELDSPKVRANRSLIRFNGNGVDLNRNWETPDWQADVVYSQNDVRKGAGGKKPMSESEVQYLALMLYQWNTLYENLYIIMLHSYVLNQQKIGEIFPAYLYNSKDKVELNPGAVELAKNFTVNNNFILSEIFSYYPVSGEFIYWCG
ncbi:MAG: hypothetical protein LBU28_10555, partial [Spirochaetaceae bacterium]|nr:hypothetical protein [Spirochaetaceae bacterium]